MELDEIKLAWQSLDARLQRHEALQLQLLTERRLDGIRRGLRPLFWGQALQLVFGFAVMLLGVACWHGHAAIPHLLVAGVILHLYGVASMVLAGAILTLISRLDPSATVLAAQVQVARLRRLHALNGLVAGLPWWLLWIPFLMALAALGGHDVLGSGATAWLWLNLALGLMGMPAVLVAMVRITRRRGQPWRDALVDALAGRRLHETSARLDEIVRFAHE